MADKPAKPARPADAKAAKDAPNVKDEKDPKDGAEGADGAEAPKTKSRGKLFIVLAVVLVLLGGGGAGAYFMFVKPAAPPANAARRTAEKKVEANGIVSFEPFIVNLADPGKRRFLRINVRLLVGEAEEAERIQKSDVLQTRLRSDILELLAEQTSETLASAEGKAALKKAIGERAHHILQKTEVADVLFSDFVIQ